MQNITGYTNSTILPKIGFPVEAIVSLPPCFLFLYVNLVMLLTLRSKVMFCETPRYILFTHLLGCDSLQLAGTITFYIMFYTITSEKEAHIISYVCYPIYIICRITNNLLSPIFLVLMSLERYVAICFPLRHGEIANRTRAVWAVSIVWFLGLTAFGVEMITAFVPDSPTKLNTCSDFIVSQPKIYFTINSAVLGIVFSTVSITIIYIYIAILQTAKSAASDKSSDGKAHKTVLLHMVQLGLYVISLFYGMIRRALSLSNLDPGTVKRLTDFFFITFNILPRCLSPLIYGIRDQTFSAFFKINFIFCSKKRAAITVVA